MTPQSQSFRLDNKLGIAKAMSTAGASILLVSRQTPDLDNAVAEIRAAGKPGKIVNIASLMTSASRPGTAACTASKGGIGQFTKALALD